MEIMEEFKNDDGNCPNLIYLNHRLIKNNQIQSVEKLNLKNFFVFCVYLANIFLKIISGFSFKWKDIYTLPCVLANS